MTRGTLRELANAGPSEKENHKGARTLFYHQGVTKVFSLNRVQAASEQDLTYVILILEGVTLWALFLSDEEERETDGEVMR